MSKISKLTNTLSRDFALTDDSIAGMMYNNSALMNPSMEDGQTIIIDDRGTNPSPQTKKKSGWDTAKKVAIGAGLGYGALKLLKHAPGTIGDIATNVDDKITSTVSNATQGIKDRITGNRELGEYKKLGFDDEQAKALLGSGASELISNKGYNYFYDPEKKTVTFIDKIVNNKGLTIPLTGFQKAARTKNFDFLVPDVSSLPDLSQSKLSAITHYLSRDFDEYSQGIDPNLMLYMQMQQKKKSGFSPENLLKWGGVALVGSYVWDKYNDSPSRQIKRKIAEIDLKKKEKELEELEKKDKVEEQEDKKSNEDKGISS